MSMRIVLGISAALSALTLVACSPPPIRCETDDHCLEEQKCDVRQGLCVDEGEYIEEPGSGGSSTGAAMGSCTPAQGR